MPVSLTRHGLAAAAFVFLIVYWLTCDFFGYEILAEVAVFAILAMSLDLVAGYTGLVSLAHAALFGTGAYLFAVFTTMLGWPVPPAMAAAALSTGVIALIVGGVVTGTHGIFFIMITLAIGQMGYEFFFQNRALGGDDGMGGIPRLDLTSIGIDLFHPANFALFCILVLAVVYLLLAKLVASPYGAALVGIHENPKRMRGLGLPVRSYQTSVFALSGAIAGFAGSLWIQRDGFVHPGLLEWTVSGEVLVMVILGGLGTLVGPIVGAIALVMLKHEISGFTHYWHFWLGAFLIAVVMLGRNGLIGWIEWGTAGLAGRGKTKKDDAGHAVG